MTTETMKLIVSEILKQYEFSENEINFLDFANTNITEYINYTQVLSTLLLMKQSKLQAEAENRLTSRMTWFTFVIAIATVVNVAVGYFN